MISLLNVIISFLMLVLSPQLEIARQKEKILEISHKIECSYAENEFLNKI